MRGAACPAGCGSMEWGRAGWGDRLTPATCVCSSVLCQTLLQTGDFMPRDLWWQSWWERREKTRGLRGGVISKFPLSLSVIGYKEFTIEANNMLDEDDLGTVSFWNQSYDTAIVMVLVSVFLFFSCCSGLGVSPWCTYTFTCGAMVVKAMFCLHHA